MMWLWAALSLAQAAPPECTPLTEADLADRIHASLDAIHRADLQGHRAIIGDLEQRLPCLDFVPPPERWAELLVGLAIVEHAEGGDWQAPLTTALRIDPEVHLLVGPSHTFRTWEVPEPSTEPGRPVPPGVRIYLDGELVSEVRHDGGLHLAQRRTGDGWNTLLLRDEPLPEAWFEEPTLAYGGWRVRLAGAVGGGLGQFDQQVDPEGTWLAGSSASGPAFGGSVRGSVGPGSIPGLYLAGRAPQLGQGAGSLAHAGTEIPLGPLALDLGVGALVHRAQDGDAEQHALSVVPAGALNLQVSKLDLRIEGAGKPSLLGLGGAAGWVLTNGPVGLRVGLDGWWQTADWQQNGVDRTIRASDLWAQATVGLVWRKEP